MYIYEKVIKRFFDLLLGIIALPFLGLATLIIAVLIKREDKGPVFYNAPRVGRYGRLFTMFKFRTMYVNSPDLKMPDGTTYNAPDDPRLTRIGARLRRSSFDELPQILNIIRGDMSFIGPRPDLEEEAEMYEGDEELKLEVRPGISGYSQVYGRNAINFSERLALDVEYVQRIGFLLDLRIFLRTFVVVFTGQGVYVEQSEKTEDFEAEVSFDSPAGSVSYAASDYTYDSDYDSDFDQNDDLDSDQKPSQKASILAFPSKDSSNDINKPIELVSLVVVAKDEEQYLPWILGDIVVQDYPHSNIELLLVDSNAGANVEQRQLMEAAIRIAVDDYGFRRVVVLDNPSSLIPHGYNIALATYEGDVFLRVDAHARIPVEFVSRNVEVLEEGHDVCGGFRPVILEDPSAWKETLLAAEGSVFGASSANYRRAQRAREVRSVFHGAYRREVMTTVGNYDERLLRTEDNDLSQRVRAAGFDIWMDPRIYSQQYLRSNFRALLKQKTANGYWIGRTLRLKPKAVSLMHFVPFAFELALLVTTILGFSLSWLPLLTLGYIYACAAALFSLITAFKAENPQPFMLLLPLIFLTMHLCYGFGTLAGLVRGLFPVSTMSPER